MGDKDTDHADALVFFGATGDLAYKQVFPALQSMIKDGRLDVPVVGVAKAGWGLDDLLERAHKSLEEHGGVDKDAFERLRGLLRYVDGDYGDADTFKRLREQIGSARLPLHYLAIPPSMFATVAKGLAESGSAEGARVVVEKPFGRDLASARELNATLRRYFPERSIFRIDHYLGKEAVENVAFFRFANSFLEPIWNRTHIQSVQLTMAESFGVQGRGRFYDEAGAIRDVIQNHMIQVVSLLAMEPPGGGDADAMRSRQADVVRAIRPLRPEDIVRGQFEGYRSEPGVASDSDVETFAAMRLHVDTWRWAGVPFLVRAGKRLPTTGTEVIVRLKAPPRRSFPGEARHATAIRFRLSPDVLVSLGARVKAPGEGMKGEDAELVAHEAPALQMPPYERLLGDAMRGDQTQFAREDYVEASWRIVDPILGDVVPIKTYEPGTWGPPEADRLAAHCGRWQDPGAPLEAWGEPDHPA